MAFNFYHYPHTDLNQANFEWIIQQIKALQSGSGETAANIYYIGSIDDLDTFAAGSSKGLLVVNDGSTHAVSAGTVFNSSLSILFISGMLSGTFEIQGAILAPRQQIFASGSTVTINGSKTPVGYPEWFGAAANSSSVDSTSAIQTCINAFPITELAAGDYYVAGGLLISASNRILRGQGAVSYNGSTWQGGTRLISSAGVDAITIADPSEAFAVTTITVQDLSILPLIADYTAAGRGIRVHCMRNLHLERITIQDYTTGIAIGSIMDGWIRECRYLNRKAQGSAAVTTGINILQELPYASSNSSISSLWILDSEINYINTGTNTTTGYGIRSEAGTTGLADLYIHNNNFVGVPYAVRLIGSGSGNAIQQNIFLRDNTIDNCISAVEISGNLKAYVLNNWISCGAYAAGSTHRGIYLHDNVTSGVTVACNTIKNADSSTATAYGIRCAEISGVTGHDNTIINFPYPVFVGTGSGSSLYGYDLGVHAINNKQQYSGSTNNIMRVADCHHGRFTASSSGQYGYNTGIYFSSNSYSCVGDASGVDLNTTSPKAAVAGTAFTAPFVSDTNNNVAIYA